MDTLCALVRSMGPLFSVFVPVLGATLAHAGISHRRYEELVAPLALAMDGCMKRPETNARAASRRVLVQDLSKVPRLCDGGNNGSRNRWNASKSTSIGRVGDHF